MRVREKSLVTRGRACSGNSLKDSSVTVYKSPTSEVLRSITPTQHHFLLLFGQVAVCYKRQHRHRLHRCLSVTSLSVDTHRHANCFYSNVRSSHLNFTATPSNLLALEEETPKLKVELQKLKDLLQHVLDHSIEYDSRLLEFTEDVFVVGKCSEETHRYILLQNPSTPGFKSRTQPSVEILDFQQPANKQSSNRRRKRTSGQKRSSTKLLESKHSLRFPSIAIESDSQVQRLAGLVHQFVALKTIVGGVSRRGIDLLAVTTDGPSSLGGCLIIIAGINDVANGEQRNIFRRLDHLITARLVTSAMIVATLPFHHDMPACHPVYHQTLLINNYIEDVSASSPTTGCIYVCRASEFWLSCCLGVCTEPKKIPSILALYDCLMPDATDQSSPSMCRPPSRDDPTSLQTETYADIVKEYLSRSKNTVKATISIVEDRTSVVVAGALIMTNVTLSPNKHSNIN
ncbi:hypothetical protein J6590_025508 [Homalodisca vitripennis]|nr:hypothetical protein J6590_027523 [Homalodisca vitripennis]KAG8278189.1 hypothetical protein J6590_025508 [Homalodisca vitripennis]